MSLRPCTLTFVHKFIETTWCSEIFRTQGLLLLYHNSQLYVIFDRIATILHNNKHTQKDLLELLHVLCMFIGSLNFSVFGLCQDKCSYK